MHTNIALRYLEKACKAKEDILKKCANNLNGGESNNKIDEAVWNAKNNASDDTSINGFRKDMGDELANKFIRGVITGTVLKIILIVAFIPIM